MNTKVQKWGNSLAVRIPRKLAEDLRLKAGTFISFSKTGNKLTITPSVPVYTLQDMINNFSKSKGHEIVWEDDKPRGKEVW